MNITIADFSESRLVYTCPLYQYDYGQILRIQGVELPDAYEVHFANTDKTGESVTQIGNADGVVRHAGTRRRTADHAGGVGRISGTRTDRRTD